MIAVYTGNNPQILIQGRVFHKDVPTFIDPACHKSVKDNPNFALYNPFYKDYKSGGKILIQFPSRIDWVIACKPVIERIRQNYPTCELVGVVSAEFADLVNIPTTNSRPTGQFYRTIDLSLTTNQHYLTPHFLKNHFEECALFLFCNMLEMPKDGDIEWKATTIDGKEAVGKSFDVCILNKGRNIASTHLYDAEKLKDLLNKAGLSYTEDSPYTSRLVVALGESDLSYRCVASGKNSIVFINRLASKGMELQYARYENCELATGNSLQVTDLEDLVKRIKEKLGVNNDAQPIKAKSRRGRQNEYSFYEKYISRRPDSDGETGRSDDSGDGSGESRPVEDGV